MPGAATGDDSGQTSETAGDTSARPRCCRIGSPHQPASASLANPSLRTAQTAQGGEIRPEPPPLHAPIPVPVQSRHSCSLMGRARRRREGLGGQPTGSLLATLPFPALLPQLIPIASATEVHARVQKGSGGAAELELERYTDQEQGFTLLKPTSRPTAGAMPLFQQEGKGSNNIGVVVNDVRLNSLAEFGTPQLVADRFRQTEKKKGLSSRLAATGSGWTMYQMSRIVKHLQAFIRTPV